MGKGSGVNKPTAYWDEDIERLKEKLRHAIEVGRLMELLMSLIDSAHFQNSSNSPDAPTSSE